MAVILSLICTMSNLDNPESVGLRVAAADEWCLCGDVIVSGVICLFAV